MANYAPLVAKKIEPSNEKRSKSFGIFFSIILTALLVGAAAFAYQYLVVKPNQADELSQKEQELNSVNQQYILTQKELADLQKEKEEAAKKMLNYNNLTYNYSLSYPVNYTVNDRSDENTHDIRFIQQDNQQNLVRLSIRSKDTDEVISDPSALQISVAGITAYKYSIGGEGTFEAPMTEVKFEKDDKIYDFQFNGFTDITEQNLEILNSFQFIN